MAHKLVLTATSAGTANQHAAFSDDAISWSTATTTTFNNGSGASFGDGGNAVAFAPSISTTVAVMTGSVSGNPTAGPVMYSLDGGGTWTGTGTNMLGQDWTSVCWADTLGLFVAIANSGTNRVATSSDGITWTLHSAASASTWNSVCWSHDLGLLVAVGSSGAGMTSTNGTSWTTHNLASATWNCICWCGGTIQKFLAVNGSGNYSTSADAVTWSTPTGTSNVVTGPCAYSADLGMAIIVGGNSGKLSHSTDLSTWTSIGTGLGSNPFAAICWSHSLTLWVIALASTIYTSPDGLTWTSRTAATAAAWASATAIDVPPPSGTWASTEADDTMSFQGGVLGGTWASTEAKDAFSFIGGRPIGTWTSTEAKDAMAFVGHPELSGVWASTGNADTMSVAGLGSIATTFDTTTASPGIDFQALNLTVVNQEAFGVPSGAKSNTSQSTGKLYAEFTTLLVNVNSGVGIGNALADFTTWGGSNPATNGAGTIQDQDGTIWINGVEQSNWEAVTLASAVVRVAIDLDNDLIWFSINGGFWNGLAGGNPANGIASPRPPSNQPQVGSGGYDISAITANGPIYLWAELINAYDQVTLNAGATAFAYSVPTGFTAWDSTAPAASPPQLDGYATGSASTVNNGPEQTSGNVTLSTTQTNDVIVLGVASGTGDATLVNNVTSTSGLVWKRRNRRWQGGGFKNNHGGTIVESGVDIEIWWAHAPAILTAEVITVHMDTNNTDGGTGSISLIAFGVSGANYTTPWDTHTLAGGYVDPVGESGNSLFFFPPTAELSTKATNTFLFGIRGSHSSDTDAGVTQKPWTYVTSVSANEANNFGSRLCLVYQTVEEPQFNTDVVVGIDIAGIGNVFTAHSMMFDSIVAAGETGTANEIVWFWDPTSIASAIQLSTGTSLQLGYTATNFNLMVIVEVVIMSASGLGEVTSISESQGSLSTTGFERRSRTMTSTPLGPLAVEIWWGWMPMYTAPERPSNDTITINTTHTGPGDLIGAIIMGLGGSTGAFGLGDPFWDNNPSVPATNSNSSGSPPPYATDISTTIPSDLVVAWTANNTQNVPGFTDPFVTLLQSYPHTVSPVMQLNSVAPPLFTGFEFYYEPGLATNETAEFLEAPEPDGWVVIADAIPVGPPQPPSGTMHTTDQQDKFTHGGNYTAIGIASPGGWVGAPENFGVIAAVEHEDINGGTPNLGYSPFLGEGWLGGVAAHATWASTERADQMAFYGWVLGFGITGQLHATENKDREAFSNRTAVTGTMGAVETKDRWASAGLVLPPGRIHPTTPYKRRLLIIT